MEGNSTNYYKNEKKRVIVVGAGIAGLSAALELLKSDLFHVTILEARDEAGGRVRTISTEYGCLEMGAQWLHGRHHGLYDLAKSNGLLSTSISLEGQGTFLASDGSVVPPELVKEVRSNFRRCLKTCESLAGCEGNISVGDHVSQTFWSIYDNTVLTTQQRTLIHGLFQWNLRFEECDKACEDLTKLPSACFSQCKVFPEEDLVNFKQGFRSLVSVLVKRLPEGTIQFNREVTRIDWTQNGDVVKVQCRDGLTETCHHVLVTIPAGYLQTHPRLFHPLLPFSYREALNSIGFGLINKILLVYEEPWWEVYGNGIQIVWTDLAKHDHSHREWTRYLLGFDTLVDRKNVLLAWVSCRGAVMVESLPDNTVIQDVVRLLQTFTGRTDLPKPKKIFRSSWGSDEFTLGAYSYRKKTRISTGETVYDVLTTPLYTNTRSSPSKYPAVLLAGEALSEHYFSTTHGAYESGREQAGKIIQYVSSMRRRRHVDSLAQRKTELRPTTCPPHIYQRLFIF